MESLFSQLKLCSQGELSAGTCKINKFSHETGKLLSGKNNAESTINDGIKMVERKLIFLNGRPLKIGIPELIIQTGASKTGWGGFFLGVKTVGYGHFRSRKSISVSYKFAILTFTRVRSVRAIHVQIDNITVLTYFLKMGDIHSLEFL